MNNQFDELTRSPAHFITCRAALKKFGISLPGMALAALVFTIVGLQLPTPVTAATITVSNTKDKGAGSLRQAIQNAASGDTINFSVTGAITLTSEALLVAKNLSIVGPGASSLAVSGHTNSRVFEISSNVIVSISGLTIRDGHAPDKTVATGTVGNGGGVLNGGRLTLTRCTVSGNVAGSDFTYYSASATPGPGGAGGGIYNVGTLTLTMCEVSSNSAGNGDSYVPRPGVWGSPGGPGGFGGGIYNGGTLALASCTVSGNVAGAGGKGANNLGGVAPVGGAGGLGGGIYNAGTSILTNCTLASNMGGLGGVGGVRGSIATVSHGVRGGAGGAGGGAYNAGGLTLIACTLSGNAAGAGGTGGNGHYGGLGGAGGSAGAIYNAAGASAVTMRNSLAALNQAGAGGAGAPGVGIPGAPGATGTGPDLYGAFMSQGHNLVGQADGSTGLTNGLNSDLAGSIAAPLNPSLGSLQNNGGSTPTMAVLSGSPARDAGDDALTSAPFNLTTDQRGLPRKFGAHVDIGAYENQAATLTNLTTSRITVLNGSPSQELRFVVVSQPGTTGTIEASTDLHTWILLTNFASASDGTYEFTDYSTPNFPQRFFRVVTP